MLGGALDVGTVFKLDLLPVLSAQPTGEAIILSWDDPNFTLQAAPEVLGGYTNIPGATSPYTNAMLEPQRFFRLIGN